VKRFAVIGAGPAGLAAAWRLQAAGARVRLYDPAGPGGRLRTESVDGLAVDTGVQLLASQYTRTFALVREAGAGALLVRAPGRDALWRKGRIQPVVYGSLTSLAASGALPAGLKLRLAAKYAPFLMGGAAAGLNPVEPAAGPGPELDGESIAAWGRRELGEDFVELVAYPLLASYYGTTPEETSAGFYHALARAGLDVMVYGVRGGAAALGRALGDALVARGGELRRARARVLELTESGALVEELAAGEAAERRPGGAERFDGVVAAVQGAELAAVLPGGVPGAAPGGAALAGWLAGTRTRPALTVALALSRPAPAEWFGLFFPRTAAPGDRIAALCFQSRKGTGLGGEGRESVLAVLAPGAWADPLGAEPRALVDAAVGALERVLPGYGGAVTRARLARFRAGRSPLPPGGLRHLRAFRAEWLPPRLALAGDWLVAPTVEGAVRSGERAAARLLAERG
jgi:protoporphyrinogen/coproporphyrinogen III oxidase